MTGPITRRAIVAGFGGLAAIDSRFARAAAYPERHVTIIVPFAAGGSGDVYCRLLAPYLEKALGQPFIVDDRPGAASLIGSEYVRTSAPDGYTLLLISNTHTVNETLYPKKPFKLVDDFAAVAPINAADLVLVTRPTLGAKTVADIIGMAKAAPGKLTFASSGAGTPYHMAGELFKQQAGVDLLHIPYKGSTPARMDVISGQADMMFDATTTMIGQIAAKQVIGIATTGTARSTALATLPTVGETVPGYTALIWLGLVAPKGTPDDVVDRLNAVVSEIARKPEVASNWRQQGAEPMILSASAFAGFIADDVKKWSSVVTAAGLTAQ